MYKVKELYCLVEDDDGHTYLIPKQDYTMFIVEFNHANYHLDNYLDSTPFEDQDEDYLYELKQAVWDCYEGYDRLEGEKYYVVLPKDVVKEK